MRTHVQRLSLAFASGVAGVAIMFVIFAALMTSGLQNAITVPTEPRVEPLPFVYSRMIWGGLWALLLAIPMSIDRWLVRGLGLAAAASLASVFYFHPFLQTSDPAFVALLLAMNIIWGMTSAALFVWLVVRDQPGATSPRQHSST